MWDCVYDMPLLASLERLLSDPFILDDVIVCIIMGGWVGDQLYLSYIFIVLILYPTASNAGFKRT